MMKKILKVMAAVLLVGAVSTLTYANAAEPQSFSEDFTMNGTKYRFAGSSNVEKKYGSANTSALILNYEGDQVRPTTCNVSMNFRYRDLYTQESYTYSAANNGLGSVIVSKTLEGDTLTKKLIGEYVFAKHGVITAAGYQIKNTEYYLTN